MPTRPPPRKAAPAAKATSRGAVRLTYGQLGQRLGISAADAQKAVAKHRWPVRAGKEGEVVVITIEQIRLARGAPTRPVRPGSTRRVSLDDLARRLRTTHDAARKTAMRKGWRIHYSTGFIAGTGLVPAETYVDVDKSFAFPKAAR